MKDVHDFAVTSVPRDGDDLWLPLTRDRSFVTGRYRLAAGASDLQTPHDTDELYYVRSGRGTVVLGDSRKNIGPGDLVYVPAYAPHRFVDIVETLDLLVVFTTARHPD